jgi:hypothetical protein
MHSMHDWLLSCDDSRRQTTGHTLGAVLLRTCINGIHTLSWAPMQSGIFLSTTTSRAAVGQANFSRAAAAAAVVADAAVAAAAAAGAAAGAARRPIGRSPTPAGALVPRLRRRRRRHLLARVYLRGWRRARCGPHLSHVQQLGKDVCSHLVITSRFSGGFWCISLTSQPYHHRVGLHSVTPAGCGRDVVSQHSAPMGAVPAWPCGHSCLLVARVAMPCTHRGQ